MSEHIYEKLPDPYTAAQLALIDSARYLLNSSRADYLGVHYATRRTTTVEKIQLILRSLLGVVPYSHRMPDELHIKANTAIEITNFDLRTIDGTSGRLKLRHIKKRNLDDGSESETLTMFKTEITTPEGAEDTASQETTVWKQELLVPINDISKIVVLQDEIDAAIAGLQ